MASFFMSAHGIMGKTMDIVPIVPDLHHSIIPIVSEANSVQYVFLKGTGLK